MDIKQLKEHLINNENYIEDIINKYFYNVKYYNSSGQWRFGNTPDCNPNSVRLSSNCLSYKNYKTNEKGDIFSLLMDRLNINLGKVLSILKDGSYFIEEQKEYVSVFNNYFKNLCKNDVSDIITLDKKEIEIYPEIISKFFLSEGITIEAQEKFNIRYDLDSNRVVIPVYLKGCLVGAIGRYNKKDVGDMPKYLPTINYPKNKVIFGYDVNYSNIKNKTIYIVESEKTVIKAYGMGYNNLVALGGNSISKKQVELIYSLSPKNIILVLDKGLGRENARELGIEENDYMEKRILDEVSKLKTNNVYLKYNIGYINCNKITDVEDKENIFEYENARDYFNNVEFII